MTDKKSRTIALLTGVILVVGWACRRSGVVYDGFETQGLGRCWDTTKFIPGAVQVQALVKRAGEKAVQITLHSGDQIPQERGSKFERAELREARRLWSSEDSEYTYSFSVFLPEKFPIVPTRLVVAQWKQYCPVKSCTPDHPVLAFRYSGGELSITRSVAADTDVLYRARNDIRNRWLDIKVQVRFSRSQDGRIKAWLGDTMVVDFKGVTAYPVSGGYVKRALFYFKMGLYRDRMPEPMTIYFDEYRKEQVPADL